MGHETPIKQRMRITFGKSGALRYTGHLDMMKLWERVLRRAGVPILYTQGFNAHPRIQLAAPLPLGFTSDCEILDMMLSQPLPDLQTLPQRMESASPAGLTVSHIEEIPPQDPALQALIQSAEYRITFADPVDDLAERIESVLAADEILQAKKAKRGRVKTVNIRPSIYRVTLEAPYTLLVHLACGELHNLRPDVLLDAMTLSEIPVRIHRFRLHLDSKRERT